ncbi:lebercilin [Atheta coriaria]|uniref:lebercilin n=1 Tax=Dalotia coriaria TaxID=877792 RepID=UPI0031F408B2
MASACSSSMSVQKSGASNITSTTASGSRKKTESDCSKKPSCFLQRKKPANPLSVSIRPPKVDAVRQRVRSARMLKIRGLQSQLNDANFHLMELAHENRALKSTQRRQDKALNNYEGVNADLPRLIQSHSEEHRILQERNRTLKRQLREVTDTLKVRDDELLAAKDQLKQLTLLAKDKQLEERAQLRTSLNEAKELIKSYESEISILNRKLALEVKNCRQKLNAEAVKYKKCQEQLAQALGQAKLNSSSTRLLSRRYDNSPISDRKSTMNLSSSTSKETLDLDVKLEPIKKRNSAESRNSLTSPVEKIKARLSTTTTGEAGRVHRIEDFSDVLEKINLEEEHLKKSLQSGIKSINKFKPTKLETLVQKRNELQLQSVEKEDKGLKIEPPPRPPPPKLIHQQQIHVENQENDELTPLKDEDILENTNIADVLDHHVKTLQESEVGFNYAREELKNIEELEAQIDRNKQTIILKREDNELVDEIWHEEYSFRVANHSEELVKNGKDGLTNGELEEVHETKKDPIVALENKKKLLAALRQIDNGNSIEQDTNKPDVDIAHNNNNEIDTRKSRLMKELFG